MDSFFLKCIIFQLQNSATLRSVGGLRTQFSEASNVQLSMLTANFMRNLNVVSSKS